MRGDRHRQASEKPAIRARRDDRRFHVCGHGRLFCLSLESIRYLPQILVEPLRSLSNVHRQSSVGAGQSKVATMPTTKYGNKLDGYTRLFQRGFHKSSFFEGNDFVRVAVKQ